MPGGVERGGGGTPSVHIRSLESERLSEYGAILRPGAWALVAVALGLLVARLPLPLLALGVGGIALVVGSVVEPLVGVGAALLVGPLRAWLAIRAPSPVPEVGQAVLVVALAAYLARKLARRSLRVPVPTMLNPLVAFVAMGLVSLWNPVDAWAGLLEWVKWLQVLLVGVVVYDRITGEDDAIRLPRAFSLHRQAVSGGEWSTREPIRARRSVAMLAGAGLSQALIGLWQFGLRGEGVAEFAINARFYRAYGTFQQPNPFAGLMGLIGALLVGVTLATLVAWWRGGTGQGGLAQTVLFGVPALVVVAALGASWSRGGWMGFGAATLVVGMLLPRKGIWGVIAVAALVAAAVGLYVTGGLPAPVAERLTGFLAYVRFEDVRGVGITDANFSVIERMAHWQAGLAMWRQRFWLGIGLGGYEAAYPEFRLINWPLPLGHAHNTYLNMLAEVGILGFVVYMVWLATQLVGLLCALRRASGWTRVLALGLLAAWTHFAVHSLVDSLLVNDVHLHAGVLAGLSAWVVGRASGAKDGDRASVLQGAL